MNYLTKMTVPALKALAAEMNLTVTSRMKKADIIALITEYIDGWHVIALDMDRSMTLEAEIQREKEETARDAEHPDNFIPTYTVRDENGAEIITLTGDSALVMEYHIKNVKRYNPGMVRDREGNVKLTPKQRKRVQKKVHSYARAIGFYGKVPA